MNRYCQKCGSRIDQLTGLCPECSQNARRKHQNHLSKEESHGTVIFVCIWLLVLAILAMIIAYILVNFGFVKINAMEETVEAEESGATDNPIDLREPTLSHIHEWEEATCTERETCSICGETRREKLEHIWMQSSCVAPETCALCGETQGELSDHLWMEATYLSPMTCSVCGKTKGNVLQAEPVYINDLEYHDKYGKLWTKSATVLDYYTHSNVEDPEAYMDMYTRGHIAGKVYDHLGIEYTCGLWVDLGGTAESYYISYELNGMYSTFSGVCSMAADMINTKYSKYFEIYCDGVLKYTSPTMTYGASPVPFCLDVTGVKILRIQYPPTKGPNRIATLYDGLLS